MLFAQKDWCFEAYRCKRNNTNRESKAIPKTAPMKLERSDRAENNQVVRNLCSCHLQVSHCCCRCLFCSHKPTLSALAASAWLARKRSVPSELSARRGHAGYLHLRPGLRPHRAHLRAQGSRKRTMRGGLHLDSHHNKLYRRLFELNAETEGVDFDGTGRKTKEHIRRRGHVRR